MLDLVIRDGWVCDGSDGGRSADLGIQDGRIAAIGQDLGSASVTISAASRIVTPGFIDMHTHSDFTLPVRPQAEAKLMQGVTTDVTGNCGFSPFPLGETTAERSYGQFLEAGLRDRWVSLRSFADAVNAARPAINLAPFVGLGAVRLAAMGDQERPADVSELREMRRMVDQALTEGAFGVSTGLIYPPGSYADVDEIAYVVAPLAGGRGIYATHVRNEADELEAAVEEALTVGALVGCGVQLSHHKCLGRRNWGKVRGTLDRVDEANRNGGDVHLDVYPYTAASSTLSSLLPPAAWGGGLEGFRARIADAGYRRSLAAFAEQRAPFAPSDVILAEVPSFPELSGRRISHIAASEGVSEGELVLRLLERDGFDVVMVAFGMDEGDLRRVLTHPRTSIGSDGWVMAREANGYVHPRNFACSVRLLARYVRDESVLSLAEAIWKLSAAPAARLGLADRGRLVVGAIADLVVFQLDQLQERATFEEPCGYPSGVEHVFVAGEHVVEDGQLTGRRPGRVLLAGDAGNRVGHD
jgi:N-acyl-D-amino-acid deacylase